MNWKRPIARLMNRNRTTSKLRALVNLGKEGSYLRQVGWFESYYSAMPVDRNRNPVPWITYPAMKFIEARLRPEMRVFEYGSGNSTLWWANHVSSVVSCEHDAEWHKKMAPTLPASVCYILASRENGYSRVAVGYESEFDIIVIDGRDRVKCCHNSLGALKPNGVIIWDNSEREKYESAYKLLRESGFSRLDFMGIGPIHPFSWSTSIFYRTQNCFGI